MPHDLLTKALTMNHDIKHFIITVELVGLYGGSVRLEAAPTGGLRVELELPGT